MKAFQITGTQGLDSLQKVDLPPPTPGHGEVSVRIRAVSLNYRDYMNVCGIRGVTGPLPRIPCSDGAGEVLATGPGVTQWKVGDRVVIPFMPTWIDGEFTQAHAANALGGAVDGLLREQACLPADSLLPIPDRLSYEQAATLPCAAVTAWDALVVRGGVKPGDSVLILGSGGVSVFALQLAQLLNARVLAISSHDDKAARLQALGAVATLNYRTHPDWQNWVLEHTSGLGVDHIIEIGGPETLNRSLQSVRFGGHIALIGVLTGTAGDVQTVQILRKGIRLNGIYVGSRRMFSDLLAAIETSGLEPQIDSVFPFDQAPDAFRHLESAQHFGKIVISLG